jgi:hypothetical protein
MNDRPTAVELLRAVEAFLEGEVVSALQGPSRFHARVAANVVAIVARELETEDAHGAAEWERLSRLLGEAGPPPAGRAALREGLRARSQALCERIRTGEADAGSFRTAVLAHLRATVDDKLAVSRPPRVGRASPARNEPKASGGAE